MASVLTETEIRRATSRAAAGATFYTGYCYDGRLNRCRIYAVADGTGGIEWRVVRVPYDAEGEEGGVERCFRTYADAMRWIS